MIEEKKRKAAVEHALKMKIEEEKVHTFTPQI
jgi:hypothetical protein